MLHLGPYGRREPGIAKHVRGVLLNPMQHARASTVAIRTAAEYLADPERYDPERAWRSALDELGAGAPEAFRTFAMAHRFSALWPEDRDAELEAALDALRAALAAEADPRVEIGALRELLACRAQAAPRLREGLRDRALAAELEPWLASHERETGRMRAAVDALEALTGDGELAGRTLAYVRFEARLSRQRENGPASYGPRRVLYPQLASLRDDSMRFGTDPALYRDRCLADDFVALVEQVAHRDLRLG
jgi:hyaluronoglucosaminidase